MANTAPLYFSLWSVPNISTDLLWVLSLVFALIGMLFFAFIFYTRNKQKAFALKVSDRRATLAPMISSFLFSEEQQGKEELSEYIGMKLTVREMLKDPVNRKVFSEILLDLQKDLSGDIHQRLLNLYKDFGLHKDAIRKLGSRRWDVISRSILELTEMQVRSAYTTIRPYVNHPRSVVRRQAQIATVSLDKDGITYFLDSSRYEIAEWQQIVLLDLLRQFENYTPPRFRLWLTSTNRDVVLFSLRLIRYYKQVDAARAICELLRHKNKFIKIEALGCIKEFGIQDALPVMQEVFWRNTSELKIAILDTINYLGDENQIAFLQEVLDKEIDFLVKNKAMSGINTIMPDTILPTKDINPSDLEAAQRHHELPAETEPIESPLVPPVAPVTSEAGSDPEENNNPSDTQHGGEDEPNTDTIPTLGDPMIVENTLEKSSLTDDEMEAIYQMEDEQELMKGDARPSAEHPSPDLNEAQIDALMYMQGIYELLGDDVLPSDDTENVLNTLSAQERELLEKISIREALEADDPLISGEPESEGSPEVEAELTTVPDPSPDWEIEFGQMEYGIFKSLFEKADRESQLILLEELPEVGEQQDLLYLNSLQLDDEEMNHQLNRSIQRLQERLEIVTTPVTENNKLPEQEALEDPADLSFIPEFPQVSLDNEEMAQAKKQDIKFSSWLQGMVGRWYG